MRKIGILLFFLTLCTQVLWAQNPRKNVRVAPDIVVVKFASDPEQFTNSGAGRVAKPATSLAQSLGVKSARPAFPQKLAKNTTKDKSRTKSSALDNIYKLEVPAGERVEQVIARLKKQADILYAEPYYLPELLLEPNDPKLSSQYQLELVKAFEAWGVSQGSREIVIGVLDTGVDLTHPDLAEKIAYNEADPVDGIDNDGNGYVDDYYGWDFANADNDPSADTDPHGTLVAGMCAASTNNATGIAGSGFQTRFLPIKIFTSGVNYFNNGYEAIVYAADRGCQIINLSWGSPGFRSEYVQDIIDYAVLERDALVVAAAGNTPEELDFYPASYDNVLSVTATNAADTKASWSTWSRFVDLAAPGDAVFTTGNGGSYRTGTGTSYSSPLVAGAAALLRAKFPELSALQIGERLRRTADPIFTDVDPSYQHKLGSGRLNMLRALVDNTGPSVRKTKLDIWNGLGPYAYFGDTISLQLQLTNFLDSVSNLHIRMRTESPYVEFLQSEYTLGSLGSLQEVTLDKGEFRLHLKDNTPADTQISILLEYTTEGYSDYEYITFKTGGDYVDFQNGDMMLTIASNGNLGYYYDYYQQGFGLRYQNTALAHNMGLIIAQNPTAVADNAVRSLYYLERNQDFEKDKRIKFYHNSSAGLDARSQLHTLIGDSTQLDLAIEQKILGWDTQLNGGSVVLEYRLSNKADTAYQNLHLGLFADFDLNNYQQNKAAYDAEHKLSYVYSSSGGLYSGIALLTDQAPIARALDVNANSYLSVDLREEFSRNTKYHLSAAGTSITEAGTEGSGNDVAYLSGATLSQLNAGSSEHVALAFVSAPDLASLQKLSQEARENYRNYRLNPPTRDTLYACLDLPLEIIPKPGQSFTYFSDPLGEHPIGTGEKFLFHPQQKDSIIYLAPNYSAFIGDIEALYIRNLAPEADFAMSVGDTVWLEENGQGLVQFTDLSLKGTNWNWKFGNGLSSKTQHPKVIYSQPGIYTVELNLRNAGGCDMTVSKTLVAAPRTPAPEISAQFLCAGSTLVLETADQSVYNVYADAKKEQLLYRGASFSVTPASDTVFYLTAGTGGGESHVVNVPLSVFAPQASLESSYILNETQTFLQLKTTSSEVNELKEIYWFAQGIQVGSGDSLRMTIEEAQAAEQIELLFVYSNGCQLQLNQGIAPEASPQLQLSTLKVCPGTDVVVQPEGGPFRFYADEALSQQLGYGYAYTHTALTESSRLYVRSFAKGLPGPVTALPLIVAQGYAGFTASSDTVFLKSDNAMQFQADSLKNIRSWHWDFGDGYSSEEANPEHVYLQEGVYTVRLSVQTELGCVEESEQTIVALNVYGLQEDEIQSLSVYPNPSEGWLQLNLPQAVTTTARLELRSLQGRLLLQQEVKAGSTPRLDLQKLEAGVYLLQLNTQKQRYQARIIKK